MIGQVLIVVPQPRLGCRLHHSQPGLGLHSLGTVVHPEELARWLRAASTYGPPLVVLAGQPRGDTWLSCALDHANALVIPEPVNDFETPGNRDEGRSAMLRRGRTCRVVAHGRTAWRGALLSPAWVETSRTMRPRTAWRGAS